MAIVAKPGDAIAAFDSHCDESIRKAVCSMPELAICKSRIAVDDCDLITEIFFGALLESDWCQRQVHSMSPIFVLCVSAALRLRRAFKYVELNHLLKRKVAKPLRRRVTAL